MKHRKSSIKESPKKKNKTEDLLKLSRELLKNLGGHKSNGLVVTIWEAHKVEEAELKLARRNSTRKKEKKSVFVVFRHNFLISEIYIFLREF